MIKQSPESAMPEPYKTYVQQRNEVVASVLEEVVNGDDIQLCPRAILPEEQLFLTDNSHIYGAVVNDMSDGYKSILYQEGFNSIGLTTSDRAVAIEYALRQLQKGNRIRLKDPHESDGQGQHTVDSVDQLLPIFNEITHDGEHDCVLMPHLDRILERLSIGRIALGAHGHFMYVGREETVCHEGAEVYGGTTLGLFHSKSPDNAQKVEEHFAIPSGLTSLGTAALDAYAQLAVRSGRVSVDVIEGRTDSGEIVRDVIDITPRVGGTTPAETLAIREVFQNPDALCYASSTLLYNPSASPQTGTNFIDTANLVINAQIHEVIL
jgi:hypothetical protein